VTERVCRTPRSPFVIPPIGHEVTITAASRLWKSAAPACSEICDLPVGIAGGHRAPQPASGLAGRAPAFDAVYSPARFRFTIYMRSRRKKGPGLGARRQLNRLVIASIGPVCSRALREHGVTPSSKPNPPKLGPLVAGLRALSVDIAGQ